MKTLKDLFLNELADVYDAERRAIKVLPKLAKAATRPRLRALLEAHAVESKEHILKLEEVFTSIETKPRGKTCKATVGLLEEAEEVMEEFKDSPAIDAALVAVAQKLEHYEIATYGCLHEWSELLDNRKAGTLLKGILDSEKRSNDALNALAHDSLNEDALQATSETGVKKAPVVAKSGLAKR